MEQHAGEPAPDTAEDQPGEELPLIELETLLNRPPSRRKRLAEIALVLVAAVIVLALFWSSIVPRQPAATMVEPSPTPVPPSLLIESNVNYGVVTINGKQQVQPLPMLIRVHSDIYTIALDAPPFRRISCSLYLPDLKSSGFFSDEKNCLAYAATPNSPRGTPTFQLSLSLTADDLPPDQQSQVTELLTQTLTTQQDVIVPKGSYIATSISESPYLSSQRASAPLQARASIAPFAPQNLESDLPCQGYICPMLLTVQNAQSLTGQQWAINVALALRWRFSTASGTVISDVQFQTNNLYQQTETFANLFLSHDKAGDWAISQNPLVPPAANQLQDAFCAVGQNMLEWTAPPGPNGITILLHDLGAQGCEWLVQVNGVDQGTFLWRFGVLLAVDAKTHAAYTQLPVAPPEELSALGW